MFDITDKNRHIIVVYHYVEPLRRDRVGIHPCPPEEFEQQIAFLSRHYRFVSLKDTFDAARNGAKEKLCAVTFDDGLKDQYIYAVPVLERFHVPASFFIISGTFDGMMPFTHKIHLLLSLVSAEKLRAQFHSFLKTSFPQSGEKYHIPSGRHLNAQRTYGSIVPENFKEVLATLPRRMREKFLSQMFRELHLYEPQLAKEFFMDESDVKDIARRGFSVGSHAHRHEAFDVLSAKEARQDIAQSKKRLEKALTVPVDTFCYPYGRVGKNRNRLASFLAAERFSHAVTIEPRALVSSDNPMFLPRYEANDIGNFLRRKGNIIKARKTI